jgi:hypothetical protein
VLPGFLAASRQTTHLAEPGDPAGLTCQLARADTYADRFLHKRTPLSTSPLERIGKAQGPGDRSQIVQVA